MTGREAQMSSNVGVTTGLLLGSAALSTLVIGARALSNPVLGRLSEDLGPLDWDFSQSWATSLTTVGAVLGIVLSGTAIPPSGNSVNRTDFVTLNLVFGVLAVAGPFAWSTLRRGSAVNGSVRSTGSVRGFLLAGGLVLCSTLGELGTLITFALTQENGPARVILVVVFALLIVLTLLYAWRTVLDVVVAQADAGAVPATVVRLGPRAYVVGPLPEEATAGEEPAEAGEVPVLIAPLPRRVYF
jgi:hypothetical protein